MNLNNIYPQKFHRPLKWLGHHRWVICHKTDEGMGYKIQRPKPSEQEKMFYAPEEFSDAYTLIDHHSHNSAACLYLTTLATMFSMVPNFTDQH